MCLRQQEWVGTIARDRGQLLIASMICSVVHSPWLPSSLGVWLGEEHEANRTGKLVLTTSDSAVEGEC
jgi:hypothetical protein